MNEIECLEEFLRIPGYEDLEPEDQESVLKLIGKPVVKTKSPLT